MSSKDIKLKVQNGFTFDEIIKDVLYLINDEFNFIEDNENPEFIIFGPYGNDIPKRGKAVTIGYFSENITPDFRICDWALGVPLEDKYNRSNYKCIRWHGIRPEQFDRILSENDIDQIISKRNKFCNFIFSNAVPHREDFFKKLSKYKKIDAPGKSMNNMSSIDDKYSGTFWERKRKFISEYKFTIAFENYFYPGYQTEKLYDALLCNAVPIYCGDPYIDEIFNTKSFIHAREFIDINRNIIVRTLEDCSQQPFEVPINLSIYNLYMSKIMRRIRNYGRSLKTDLELNNRNYDELIDHIVKVDQDDTLYAAYLREKYLKPNHMNSYVAMQNFWRLVFSSKK